MARTEGNFVRVGPRASSGLGNLRFVSFNTWLIVLNVAIFVVNNLVLNAHALQVHTSMGRATAPGITETQLKRAVVLDVVRPDPQNPGWLYKPVVDPETFVMNPRTGGAEPKEIARDRFAIMAALESAGHFSTGKALGHFEVWRFLSFQFLHYNIVHLLFNMLGLWFVGGMVEQHLGFKRYAAFYLTCGIFGALMYLLLNLLGHFIGTVFGYSEIHIPGLLFNDIYTPLIGASAGVFGVLVAAARLEPMANVLAFFVIPVRLRTAVIVMVLISFFNLFSGSRNAGGEAAHVGGILAGFYFIRRLYLLRDFFDVLGNSRLPSRVRGPSMPTDRQIERILAKVREDGVRSLTEQERAALRRYTSGPTPS